MNVVNVMNVANVVNVMNVVRELFFEGNFGVAKFLRFCGHSNFPEKLLIFARFFYKTLLLSIF